MSDGAAEGDLRSIPGIKRATDDPITRAGLPSEERNRVGKKAGHILRGAEPSNKCGNNRSQEMSPPKDAVSAKRLPLHGFFDIQEPRIAAGQFCPLTTRFEIVVGEK